MIESELNLSKVKLNMSKDIYNELIKGKMVNRYIYSSKEHSLIPDPHFIELRENISEYSFQYKMIGHELVDKGEYFYLINRPAEKASTQDAKAKLHASLICIVRLITHEKGKLFEYLSNVNYGVTTEDLNIDELPDSYGLIMQRVKLKGFIEALKVLSEKKLVLRTNRDRYILSSSGLEIVESIINKHI
jgi:hypothetical protein